MDQASKALLKKLDEKLLALENELNALPKDQLTKKPHPTAWSVLDVLHHLKISEAGSHRYVEKKLSFNPTLPNISLSSRLRSWFLNAFNRSSLKVKAPKIVSEIHFPQGVALEQIMDEWKTQRQNLHAFSENLDGNVFKKLIYKHPLGGRLSLLNMLQFFDSHFDRHYKQIQRTLAAV